MTADQRLDQLEPLVAQTLAVADRHTAQLKQITSVVIQQSDNIGFVLHELSSLKEGVNSLKENQAAMDARIQTVDSKAEAINSQVEAINSKVDTMDSKLDRLIDLLSSGSE